MIKTGKNKMNENQSETNLVREILLRASQLQNRLWRQQTGMGWIGRSTQIKRTETVTLNRGDVVIENARPFHAGFEGQPDTGGWVSIIITPDMVGTRVAIATQIEVKTETGVKRTKQVAFGEMAKSMGVRFGFARSVADAERIMRGE